VIGTLDPGDLGDPGVPLPADQTLLLKTEN
jgi:hypothetical protein